MVALSFQTQLQLPEEGNGDCRADAEDLPLRADVRGDQHHTSLAAAAERRAAVRHQKLMFEMDNLRSIAAKDSSDCEVCAATKPLDSTTISKQKKVRPKSSRKRCLCRCRGSAPLSDPEREDPGTGGQEKWF